MSLALIASCNSTSADTQAARPNILFIVLDDVGIDQFRKFGYGGVDAPQTPVMDMLADKGVMFNNTWAMPECSPSRAVFFNGRYPTRSNINSAILSSDLANSQMSPYEYTAPKVLRTVGYESGLFGKAHFSGSPMEPANNPYGNNAQSQLGWDRYDGWFDGAPKLIDTTAGGVAPEGTYACGYVPNRLSGQPTGADSGACYTADRQCSVISTTADTPIPGLACLERGGILVPNAQCQSQVPSFVDFTKENGYYVGERVINNGDGSYRLIPPNDPSGTGRRYRTAIEADAAIDWINSRPAGKPWMATVAFSSAHIPYQPPPSAMLPKGAVLHPGVACDGEAAARPLFKQMIEAADSEIGRVLVEAKLATRKSDGTLDYDPARTNTMIVLIGDNGSYAFTVKAPFDSQYAKGSVHQTGVWVPLTVAGPLVAQPGRTVEAMINIADLYELFGEIAGVNVREVVPSNRALDSASMLPYLTRPSQTPIRDYNFTQTAPNLRAASTPQSPCVIESISICAPLWPQKEICEFEGGTWYGPNPSTNAVITNTAAPDGGFATCCALNRALYTAGKPFYKAIPELQQAVRNQNYKLIRLLKEPYNASTDSCDRVEEYQFYRVDQAKTLPRIDRPGGDNDLGTTGLSGDSLTNFNLLTAELKRVNDSVVPCDEDVNLDGVVDAKDLADMQTWITRTGGKSTWFDMNQDGFTDSLDRTLISAKLGSRCTGQR